ncbi:EamA family transporter [Brevibacillus laterosporus]|uniref:EamA family transporter n=1 Tax=Brevibacillus laterosporus TaxID=1465 RepID=UPI000AE903C7
MEYNQLSYDSDDRGDRFHTVFDCSWFDDGQYFFYWLVAKTNPVFPATWLYISPLLALGLGTYLYGEEVTYVTLLGMITIIVGIILVNVRYITTIDSQSKRKAIEVKKHPDRKKRANR